jgi:hypothetical protein
MEAPAFIELKPREEVLDVIHASILPRVGKLALLIVWVMLPFFFLFPLMREGGIGVVAFVIWLSSGLIALYRAYYMWANTVFVVTDKRVVDCEQKGLFHRVVTEARFDQIDEVSYYIKGFAPTIFRYGTVLIQLHGSSADIHVMEVKRPHRVTDLMNDLRGETYAS